MITEQQKQDWLVALRSGKYRQGKSELYCSTASSFCCLGVLGAVVGIDLSEMENVGELSELHRDDLLGPFDVSDSLFDADYRETHDTIQRQLAGMNDSGKSFSEIADWIEANVLVTSAQHMESRS